MLTTNRNQPYLATSASWKPPKTPIRYTKQRNSPTDKGKAMAALLASKTKTISKLDLQRRQMRKITAPMREMTRRVGSLRAA